jgi:hypothetical protein
LGRMGCGSSQRRQEFGQCLDHLRSEGFGCWLMMSGSSRDGRVSGICSFDIVNQVLVRLWARRWWEIRANGCLPLLSGASRGRGIAKSDRPRSLGATPGIQPSDRRHMRSEAFWRIAGCDGRWFVVCKLSSSIDVRVLPHLERSGCGWFLYMMG